MEIRASADGSLIPTGQHQPPPQREAPYKFLWSQKMFPGTVSEQRRLCSFSRIASDKMPENREAEVNSSSGGILEGCLEEVVFEQDVEG